MKKLICIMLLASIGRAASVVISESAYTDASGRLATGTLTVSWPSFSNGVANIAAGSKTVTVTNGVMSITLTANDTADPPFNYAASFSLQTSRYSQQWKVPTVAGPLTIQGVTWSSNSPVTIQPSQISKVGASAGDILCFNGTNWTRLARGADNRVLSANSALSGCKLEYVAQSGGGGGGGVSGPDTTTSTAIPLWDASDGTLLANSNLLYDGATLSGLAALSLGDGTTVGSDLLYELAVNGNNFRKWTVPSALTASLTMTSADAVPTAGQVMRFGAPSSSISAQTWGDASGVGACSANQWASTLNNNAAPTCTQPAFSNLSGSVGSSQMAVVNTRRTACMIIGGNNATEIVDGDLGPQSRQYLINAAQTVVEVTVAADAGTPNIIIGRSRAGSIANLTSSALSTAASGGIACSKATAVAGVDGATTCSATLQNTSLNAGDWITLVSGTAGGVAKEMTACVTTTVN